MCKLMEAKCEGLKENVRGESIGGGRYIDCGGGTEARGGGQA